MTRLGDIGNVNCMQIFPRPVREILHKCQAWVGRGQKSQKNINKVLNDS